MITLEKANKELKKVAGYLKENKLAWNESRNLKLYDAAFYDYSKDFPLTHKKYGNDNFNDAWRVLYNVLMTMSEYE